MIRKQLYYALAVTLLVSAFGSTSTFAATSQKAEKGTQEIPSSKGNHKGASQEFDVEPSAEIIKSIRGAYGDMTPQESVQLRNSMDEYKRADQYQKPVKAISGTYALKLHAPVKIELRLIAGFETELAFFDLQGRPWEVGSVTTGNKNLVSAIKSEVLPHTVTLSSAADKLAGRTNIKIQFKGLDASVSFPIVINTTSYHDSLKVVLPGNAPRKAESNDYQMTQRTVRHVLDDPIARAILDNPYTPESSSKCHSRKITAQDMAGQNISGLDAVAFDCNGSTYLRARYLTNPAPDPTGIINGPDGYKVFRWQDAGEVMSFRAGNGRMVFLELEKPANRVGARFDHSTAIGGR